MNGKTSPPRKQVTTMSSAKGPIHILNINRDPLSRSHRSVNLKVKNTRDILKVADYKLNEKLGEQYASPSKQNARVTSARSKRAISAIRQKQTSKPRNASQISLERADQVAATLAT